MSNRRLGHDYFDDAAERWRTYRDLPPRPRMPFGKYRDQPLEMLRRDPRYVKWLLSQDWFQAQHPELARIIVTFRR